MGSPDVYVSVDVEADARIPSEGSMSSFGMAVCGRFDGARFDRAEAGAQTFYRELKPIMDTFDAEALAVSGLDRDELARSGADARDAMNDAYAWVRDVAGDNHKPVFVAYPLGFDWLWMYTYFVRFCDQGSPFGFSNALDVKSFYAARAGCVLSDATKRNWPRELTRTAAGHTHHALDDAIEQGELFANVFGWRAPA